MGVLCIYYYSKVIEMNLPRIFKNEIDEEIKNSQEVFYSEKKTVFSDGFPFDAIIQTKARTFKTTIIGKTTNFIVTSDGKIINLKDCINIKIL